MFVSKCSCEYTYCTCTYVNMNLNGRMYSCATLSQSSVIMDPSNTIPCTHEYYLCTPRFDNRTPQIRNRLCSCCILTVYVAEQESLSEPSLNAAFRRVRKSESPGSIVSDDGLLNDVSQLYSACSRSCFNHCRDNLLYYTWKQSVPSLMTCSTTASFLHVS